MSLSNSISTICRICICDNGIGKSIYACENFSDKFLQVAEVIVTCASVQIQKSDGLPEEICSKCLLYLHHAYTFKNLCENSDYKLRNQFVQNGIETNMIKQENEEMQDFKSNESNEDNSDFPGIDSVKFSEKFNSDVCGIESIDNSNGFQGVFFVEKTQVSNSSDSDGDGGYIEGEFKAEKQCDALNFVKKSESETVCAEVQFVNVNLAHNVKVMEERDFDVEQHSETFLNTMEQFNGDDIKNESIEISEVKVEASDLDNTDFNESTNLTSTLCKKGESAHENNSIKQSPKLKKCEVCNKQFRAKHIKDHERTHLKVKPFICDICGKQYSRSTSLKNHKKVHTGEQLFKCDICDMQFTVANALKTHMMRHAGEKRFKCDICNQSFCIPCDLRRHKKLHTGEKPFKCHLCEMQFTYNNGLKSHMMTHTGERPFKCDFCDDKFRSSSDLARHVRVHTGEKPFKCNICNKRYTVKCDLDRHIRVHTGEKPFKCNICNKGYTSKSDLASHTIIHRKEKPFKCDICNNYFKSLRTLSKHRKIHTRETFLNAIGQESSNLANLPH